MEIKSDIGKKIYIFKEKVVETEKPTIITEEKIVYVDRIVEVPKEVIVYKDRYVEIPVEKVVIVEKTKEVPIETFSLSVPKDSFYPLEEMYNDFIKVKNVFTMF